MLLSLYQLYLLFVITLTIIRRFSVILRGGTLTYVEGDVHIFLYVFTVKVKNVYSYYRNYGIFSEPGQFQLYISMALIFELFYTNKIKVRRLIVYAIAIITCQSTNGYITFSLIILAFLFKSNCLNKSIRQIKIKRLITLCLCIFIVYLICNWNSNSIIQEVYEKIFNLTADYSYTDYGTSIERTRAVKVAIQAICKNPFTGLGYYGLNEYVDELSNGQHFIMTFTPLNWFAYFGMFYGIIANACYLSFFIKKGNNVISNIILALAIISMISAQAVGGDLMTLIIIYYGCNRFKWSKI